MSTGRFIWHELMTPDVNKAKDFYTSLLGWTITKVMDMGEMGTYTIFHDGHCDAGGIMALPPEQGIPPNWLPSVSVDDADASCARVKELGGAVIEGPMDIPDVGRYAIIKDDQGAVISLFQALQEPPAPEGMPRVGQFCWHSLATRDIGKATAFWTSLLGWTCAEVEIGTGARQPVLMRGDQWLASFMPLEEDSPITPHWGTSVAVESVAAALDKATSLGATTIMPPTPIGTMGLACAFTDPTGVALSLFEATQG